MVFVCYGVTPDMTCRFDGACYGEICIAPSICRKKDADLTDEDRKAIDAFNVETSDEMVRAGAEGE